MTGNILKTVDVKDVDESEIVNLMVGRKVTHDHIDRDMNIDKHIPVLQVSGLSHKRFFKDINFEIHKGEIVGFAGLIGAGRSEIARTIFGLEKKDSGRITVDGKEINPAAPIDAMNAGIAYTSESRKIDGLFLDMTISQNCIAPQLKKFSKPPFRFLDEKIIREFTEENIQRFQVSASSSNAVLRKLSGGNQQKVLLSMWLGIKTESAYSRRAD